MRSIFSMLMALGGLLFFLAGLCMPWFALPTGFEVDGSLIVRDAPSTLWWKAGCVFIIAGTLGWLLLRKKTAGQHATLSAVFAAVLPFLLWFPQSVIVMDETTSGDAGWLQQQFDNLTWLGGDIYRGHSERPVPGGMGLWAQDPPDRLAVFRPPMSGSLSLGIAEIPDMVWWFGYNPAFSQFAGKGWFLCVFGVLFMLTGSFGWGQRGAAKGERKYLLRGTAIALCGSAAIFVLLTMIPLILGGRALREARKDAMSWQPREALEKLELAGKRLPALCIDSGVILQRGALLRQLGQTDVPAAKLHEAWLLFDKGYGARSSALLEDLLKRRQQLTVSERREVLRGLLRNCIDDVNSSRLTEAKRKFGLLLDEEPTCMQAWFHYQLACLQSGDLAGNRFAASRIKPLTGSFLRKERRGILAASQGFLAQGEAAAGNDQEAIAARKLSQGR
ncbi:hypothetical protein ACFSSA_05140 [Luteolibacter algae]|uniref:Uncharacterized protein n=1 Tax=Luteolibacter algae TaxID=454151 RepID=A0ABW5D5Q2_9BACT